MVQAGLRAILVEDWAVHTHLDHALSGVDGTGPAIGIIFRENIIGSHPAAPWVQGAVFTSQQSAVQAVGDLLQPGNLRELLVLQPLVDALHHELPELGGGVAAAGVDVGVALVARPDRAAVIRGIADEVPVAPVVGRTGLTGDGHTGEIRTGAGTALDDLLKQAVHDVGGRLLHGDVGLGAVFEHDLAVGVYDLRIRPRLAVHALVCKRRVRLRHRLDGHAPGQSAHRKRRQVHVRERVSRRVHIGRHKRAESHFFLRELEAVFRGHLRDELDGDRVDGKTHSLVDVHEAPVDRIGVFRPVPRVGKRIRRIVHDR